MDWNSFDHADLARQCFVFQLEPFRKFQEQPRSLNIKLTGGLFEKDGDSIVVDQEVFDSQLKADRFPFPSEGDITLKVRNANYTLGPVMLHIGMSPGAVIPAHLHKGMAEALYVVEGDFTNEGKQYPGWHFVAFQGRQGTRPAHY